MSIKTEVAAAATGFITAGDYTIAVTDPADGLTIKIDGDILPDDGLHLVRQNFAGDDYEPVTMNGRLVLLGPYNRTATPAEVGTYSLRGHVTNTIKIWTEAI